MAASIDERLKKLGIDLPQPSSPGANYVPFVRTGSLLFLTGQLSQWNGERRFDRASRCVRVSGFVNAVPEFLEHSQVVNGASDLFVQVFGEAGRHTRMAIGVSGLPYGVAVEVEATFEVQ